MAPTISDAGPSSGPESLQQILARKLERLDGDIADLGRGRTHPQPIDELAHCALAPACQDLDASIRQIARIACDTRLTSAPRRAGAIKDALHASGHEATSRDEALSGA